MDSRKNIKKAIKTYFISSVDKKTKKIPVCTGIFQEFLEYEGYTDLTISLTFYITATGRSDISSRFAHNKVYPEGQKLKVVVIFFRTFI